jgi:DNA-binding MarR family transcriptional regulator
MICLFLHGRRGGGTGGAGADCTWHAGCSCRAVMHAIAFGTKRAFHGFLRVTRKPLAHLGLTAARFDMMHVLAGRCRQGDSPRWVRQRELREQLGVTASVVSRMLKALEKLGLLRRFRDGDRRQRIIELTDRGVACIRAARRMLLKGMHRVVCIAICFGKLRDANERFWRMEALESALDALRQDFADRARLYYPWGHPDD